MTLIQPLVDATLFYCQVKSRAPLLVLARIAVSADGDVPGRFR
ncbi:MULTISPECIES: hypothetical protein [Silvimonas]|nr:MULTISPECIES: hypothetical protein [Silvimonas]MDR3427053.1 hypothetical protein [Silvimonas sp.]